MTKDEALNILNTIPTISEQVDALEMAIKALEQQPCEDAISRQAVMNIISFEYGWLIDAKEYNTNIRIAFNSLMSRVKALPSVTPKAESKDVLAEIKAEIEQKCCITVGSENEPAITLYDVFQIIDKYKAESEGEK
jgi:hypothetical protein